MVKAARIVADYRAQAHGDPTNTSASIAIGIAGLALAAGTTAYSIASAPGAPHQPNLAASSRAMSDANAKLLPLRRQLEAAAQQGRSITVDIPSTKTVSQQFVKVPFSKMGGKFGNVPSSYTTDVPYVASEWQPGGKYSSLGNPSIFNKNTTVSSPTTTYDFTGAGTADVEGTVAKAMADAQLKLSAKYDPQFIDEALREQKLADPQSFEARQMESDLIQKQINDPVAHPVNDMLDSQIQEQLKAANSGKLTPEYQGILDESVKNALAARGGNGAGGDFSTPLTTGFAGEQAKQAAAQKADSWLASGQTPEDVDYRREQQNLANLSAEVNGRTPESEFASMSGANSGPTPVNNGQALPTLPNGQGQAAQGAAINAYGQQVNNQAQQVGSWTTGITGILNLGTLAGQAGWKPLTPTQSSN